MLLAALATCSLAENLGHAQLRFADEPTIGLFVPGVALAGDHDAISVAYNPAGLLFLGDTHLALAWTEWEEQHAGPGEGIGAYLGMPVSLPILPPMGIGIGLERLAPPRESSSPDPGSPSRLTLAQGVAWGRNGALGLAWHHFSDDGGILDSVDTFDLGVSMRLGPSWAVGAVVRDLTSPAIGGVPVQRRYVAELVSRPLGHDRWELGMSVEVGERRGDVEPKLRTAVRLAKGAWLRGELAATSRWELLEPAGGGAANERHDIRGSLGIEASFGRLGATGHGIVGRRPRGGSWLGSTGVARWSDERYPSLVPSRGHAAKIELEGKLTERELTRLVSRMRRLERDDAAKGVLLVLGGLTDGWATLQELRDGVFRLRKRGKKVLAFMRSGTTRDYYLAAAADKIYVDPAGGLRLVGLSSSVLFFKNLFDKLGVVAQFEKIEEYKSAPEAFTRDSSSDEARSMREWILGGVFDRFVADVARDRKMRVEDLRGILDRGPYTSEEAGKLGLVDGVVEPSALERILPEELGGAYALRADMVRERHESWQSAQVAIIYVDGDIVDGRSVTVPLLGQRLTGGDTIAAAISWARENPRIRAIVIRVDTPGGSALASEVIAREVFLTRGKKPVIVSMGDVAASGGYFAAAGADLIFAEPSTLTGSIGIFTGKFDLSHLLRGVGFTWETGQRGARADMESYLRPYTDEERAAIKEKLRYYYGRFISAVAKGRRMTEEQVDGVGRGRVFTGAQAMERGLVDRLGGLGDAIVHAKVQAGLDEDDRAELVMLPVEPTSLAERLLRATGAKGDEDVGAKGGASLGNLLQGFPASLLFSPEAPQARLPFWLGDMLLPFN
ncbi:MAG: signal peptide peptidase SppA [Deltaproteobacteria bacterium]|nr:signal peptide peptidase SppA [Deltaproteobacteria bacterium]